jgi:IPT/TIG domain
MMKTVCVLLLVMFAIGCGNYHSPVTGQISTLTPNTANAGDPQFAMTVNGSGFTASSIVYFNTVAETTVFMSATQLVATIPAADVTTAGVKPVYVQTPASGYSSGQKSNTVNFTVN